MRGVGKWGRERRKWRKEEVEEEEVEEEGMYNYNFMCDEGKRFS